MNYYILYNALANNGHGKDGADRLKGILSGELYYEDVTQIRDYKSFFASLPTDAQVVLCGGDGTLNRFVNATKGLRITHAVLYYPCGSGNDFARDIGAKDEPVLINRYLTDLPTVTVKGKEYTVLNGVGYGIDGYCCEVGDQIRLTSPETTINYTSIAVKGLLFDYKPTKAVVIVDGKKHYYEKVWLAPGMNGRYYGGGMIPTPAQDRLDPQGKVSVMVFHGSGKLKTLTIFPSIFKGEHVRKTKNVEVLSGYTVTVRFDEPRALQVDGETVLGVKEYTLRSNRIPSGKNKKH